MSALVMPVLTKLWLGNAMGAGGVAVESSADLRNMKASALPGWDASFRFIQGVGRPLRSS